MRLWPILLTLAAVIVSANDAAAYTTVCPERASRLYGYGTKATLSFRLPTYRMAAFTDDVERFKSFGMHFSGAVGPNFDPYKHPQITRLDQLLSSSSGDVSIKVKTDSTNKVRISVETFSYKCAATENWRPYWHTFRSYLISKGYSL